ncbi:MAG: copper transporter [Acidimicrobiales bacterium]|nr:copper transporter [Acidimicrobiales bacterium]
MINLRYHIVSITAVFLALGIGTALGGTFLDRYTVDVLDRNIRSAEARISDTEAQNARLETQIGDANARNDALIQTGSAALFAGQLEDLPVLIVTSEGIDPDVVSNLRMSLVRADADVRGTLELRDSLDLADGVDADVAKAVDADPSDPDAVRSAVYSDLRRAFYLAGRPAEEKGKGEQEGTGGTTTTVAPPVATTAPVPSLPTPSLPAPTTTAPVPNAGSKKTSEELPDGKQPEIVTTLLDNDLLRLTPGPGRSTDDPILEQRGYRYVFVGGPNLDPVASRIMLALLPTPARRAIPAVVVSPTVPPVTDGGSEGAPTVVALIRASSERAPVYSTVDGVDTFAGLTAAVLTVRDTGTGEVGHYGQAAGASALLPGST